MSSAGEAAADAGKAALAAVDVSPTLPRQDRPPLPSSADAGAAGGDGGEAPPPGAPPQPASAAAAAAAAAPPRELVSREQRDGPLRKLTTG